MNLPEGCMLLYVRKQGNGQYYIRGPDGSNLMPAEAEAYDWFRCWVQESHGEKLYQPSLRSGSYMAPKVATYALVEQDRFPLFQGERDES